MTARTVEAIGAARVVPVIRTTEPGLALPAAEALIAGGASVLEVALTCPDALEVVAALAGRIPVGAASVSSVEILEEAVRRGAAFTVSPHSDPALLERARRLGTLHIPGAATPTEAVAAVKAGAALVKIFPARELGGPVYLRALLAPLPELRLIPAGGVSPGEVAQYLAAGAFAVALGSELVRREWLRDGAWDKLQGAMEDLLARLS
ncbi:MAG TPA: bifunctional 4-hydroxy-2-oxoglutarate aldolase/2-dehydro-3-deoxy-phosphogluconate aldolase [bacterium]|nr:bifunctional 4-hydroxy-2-oxoglutarate aldolase/2-dehydro-3-deoxy-phosphogluconate aldolase [bacterium]